MGSALDLLKDWASDNDELAQQFNRTPDMMVRWLNSAQLLFCDRAEVLRSVWIPALDGDGVVSLPDDFLREVQNKVKWDATIFLIKGDFPTLNLLKLSATLRYAIWDGKFWVFAPQAGNPEIPYIRKPEEITKTSLSHSDLDLPTEMQRELITFLDACWARKKGDVVGSKKLEDLFFAKADEYGMKSRLRDVGPPQVQGGWL